MAGHYGAMSCERKLAIGCAVVEVLCDGHRIEVPGDVTACVAGHGGRPLARRVDRGAGAPSARRRPGARDRSRASAFAVGRGIGGVHRRRRDGVTLRAAVGPRSEEVRRPFESLW